ncbi:nucleotidyltransferase family protein [Primorskyibacter sedentarius]|uniref:nucleotidyltransferase family protein n=1 Tax=Primorskyibacter sedentarius TaxID=745311 RepID=UPI003EBAE9D9
MTVAIILPAAGASSRMRGADKLLQVVDGQPLLALMAARACAASKTVLVTLPSASHPRAGALSGLPIKVVTVPDAAEGMAASLRAAALALPDTVDGVMVLPADMPDITEVEISHLINAFEANPNAIVQGASAGEPGHPVLFPIDCVAQFSRLSGDRGARAILKEKAHRVHLVDLPGRAALADLDTPEDWEEWRASR